MVYANLLAASATDDVAGEVMNIACGESTSLLNLCGSLNSLTGADIKPRFENERPGDIRNSLADISKAERLIGYRPLYDLKEGLRKTVEWYAANP